MKKITTVLLLICSLSAYAQEDFIRQTDSGKVQGINDNGMLSF